MAENSSLLLIAFLIALSLPSSSSASTTSNTNSQQTYIIHVQRNLADDISTDNADDLETWYRSFLPETDTNPVSNSDRLVYSYSKVFSGFAVRLTEHELNQMSEKQGFVRAFPNTVIPLLTTHTPDFLGLKRSTGLWNSSNMGKGVIIGVLDSGIFPDHPSFDDRGVPPPPARWKGRCDLGRPNGGGCNNKIIGARTFISNDMTPIIPDPTDKVAHGMHIASVAAGNFVENVHAFDLGGNGTTASGVAPHAHLAIYNVCEGYLGNCFSADVLAGIDAAVGDGVDILSLSLGFNSSSLVQDLIAIGCFGAVQHGIVVVGAAGWGSLSNDAPWMLTVGAGTTDRSFRATVKLGDGREFYGETMYQYGNFTSPLRLNYTRNVCPEGVEDNRIVLCDLNEMSQLNPPAVADDLSDPVNNVAVIAVNLDEEGYTITNDNNWPDPGSLVSFADGVKIKEYITSVKNPTASIIFNGTVLGVSPAPTAAYYSPRGPSLVVPGILKPDVIGPGSNILAAWNKKMDTRSSYDVPFLAMSGTSIAAPHISGVAALIKSLHPDWSPAAIKSAIITSSHFQDRDGDRIKDEQLKEASFYALGAGHVNPSKAAQPGLVYDLAVEDYIAYLCGAVGENGTSIIAQRHVNCSGVKTVQDFELNYPTITVAAKTSDGVTVNRTVTNVGSAAAEYKAEVDVPEGVNVTVTPGTLKFSKVNEKLTFSVSVTATSAAEGNLKWVSGDTVVRSALVVTA